MAAAAQIAPIATPSEIPFDKGTEKTGWLSRPIIDADNQRPAFVPIHVTREAIEAYRQTEPLFTEFLIESGRVVIENMPGQPAGAKRNDIRACSH
ncbi:hypothetical protein [Methanoregula sp.]|uniref:hypothetical protein n=1 Tax=Methanoregula sp. TaxID=2052170 RepID=UPI003FD89737